MEQYTTIVTVRGKRWLIGGGIGLAVLLAAGIVAGIELAHRFEPMVRAQAIQYMEDRFHSDVELKSLKIHPPKVPWLVLLLNRGRGARVRVDAGGLSMRFRGPRNLPPLFSIQKVTFVVDLGTLGDPRKIVDDVSIDGMEINVPPKGSSAPPGGAAPENHGSRSSVLIERVRIRGAVLRILPKDEDKKPLQFLIGDLRLNSAGTNTAMKYDVALNIPKPPGHVKSLGKFGPWNAREPGDTPLAGKYAFNQADLGVFPGIGGILHSTGAFDGTLDSIHARGEATVPDFHLKSVGNPVPLTTSFEVLVDGTNGNTTLQPVHARLGSTAFTTTGAVIKHEKESHRAIDLDVSMPDGDLRDLLRLAMKGSPFMEGRINLKTRIGIPPLSGTVKKKLRLDGRFMLDDAKFLRSTIQNQIDQLSRRGRGQPDNREIDEVASDMSGSFKLENQVMTFESLSFRVPGAHVTLAGNYDLGHDTLDFHGNLKMLATISDTMTGWKHWVLKPVDPFFSKHGAGTYLRIKVDGSARRPNFGLDHGPDGQDADRAKR